MKAKIKENQKLHLIGYAFSHQCYAFKPVFHKCISLFQSAIHLKSVDSKVPSKIFDPNPVGNITIGREKNNNQMY